MRKLLSLMLIVLIGALLVVSCNDSPTPTPPTPSDPTYTPTLSAFNVKAVFEKGVSKDTAKAKGYFGSLEYRDEKGSITTIKVADSTEVTIDGYDADSVTPDDEVRTLILRYKGLSVSAKYKVYELEKPEVKGTFVIGKNQTVTLDTVMDPDHAVITTYNNYMRLYNYMYGGYTSGVETKKVSVEYKFMADTNRVKILIDGTAYASDGNGGLQGHVQDVDVLEPQFGTVYVSTEKFDSRMATQEVVRGKWLAFQFVDTAGLPMDPESYVWNFYLLNNKDDDLADAVGSFQITADKLSFDVSGVYVDKKTDLGIPTYAKNFQAGPNRDSTYTEFKGLHVVSYADNNWKGYSCTLLPR